MDSTIAAIMTAVGYIIGFSLLGFGIGIGLIGSKIAEAISGIEPLIINGIDANNETLIQHDVVTKYPCFKVICIILTLLDKNNDKPTNTVINIDVINGDQFELLSYISNAAGKSILNPIIDRIKPLIIKTGCHISLSL